MRPGLQKIVQSAENSSQLLAELYGYLKRQNSKYSLAYICQSSAIPSKGYLSDVMKGKRTLNPKHVPGLIKAFRLSGPSASLLRSLVEYERERSPTRRESLLKKIEALRKLSAVAHNQTLGLKGDVAFAFELFCRFGLVGNQATEAEILGWYPKEQERAQRTLASLLAVGLVKREGTVLSPETNQVMFGSSDQLDLHVQFLREMIQRAAEEVAFRFNQKDECHFESSFISVRREDLRLTLPKIKEVLAEIQSDLESTTADSLISFNVQIFQVI